MGKRLLTKNGQAYLFIVLLRLLAPLTVFRFPLFAVVANTLLDAIDVNFASSKVLTKSEYQQADKALDMWWLIAALVYSYFRLEPYFPLLLGLFLYRLAGYLIFTFTQKRWIFVLFPSLFIHVFLLVFFANRFEPLHYLVESQYFLGSIVIVSLAKIAQEIFLHGFRLALVEDILGHKRNWIKS